MSTADLLYSEVETDLRASVADLLADHCEPTALLARLESEHPYDLPLWRILAGELGLAGLHVPEKFGGQGASTRETAVVGEELGRRLAPVPYLGSAVLATSVLLEAGPTERDPVADLLRRLASGREIGALLLSASAAPDAAFPEAVRAEAGPTGSGTTLHGTVTTVADASAADVLVVPATGPSGPGLYEVAVPSAGVTVTEVMSLDLTRRVADVTLSGATARELAGEDQAATALRRGARTAAGLLASEQLGVAQWCLDETVAHLKQRYQFGRPVGSYQALKHRLADVWLEIVAARASARYAADVLAADSAALPPGDPDIGVAVAQSYCGGVAVHAAEEAVQLHGGIGMTWEHPAHLYLKRAKADEIVLGTPGHHRAALAGLADIPT